MGKTIIKDVDIVLLSGSMMSIYVDMDYYKYTDNELDIEGIIKLLNKKKSEKHGHKYVWYDVNQDYDNSLRLSTSAFEDFRGKEYIAGANIKDSVVDSNFIETQLKSNKEYEELYTGYMKFSELIGFEDIRFHEAKIKIGGYGDTSFRCKVSLRNRNVSVSDYYDYIQYLRILAHELYKELATDIGITYRNLFVSLSNNKDEAVRILDYNLDNEDNEKRNSEYVHERAIQAICWMHCIYNNDLFESNNFVKDLESLLIDEPDKSDGQIASFTDTKSYMGWSHSVFVIKCKEEEKVRKQLCEFYTSTFEVVWGEWEFLQKITKDLDLLTYDTYEILNSKKYLRAKTSKLKSNTNILFYSTKRLMNSFENSSVTINQVQSILMGIQKNTWSMDAYRKSFNEKSNVLNEKIEYMVNMKKTQQSRILNGILFVIALLSMIDISNTIYQVIANGTQGELTISLGPVSFIFVVLLLYNRITGQ